MLIISCSRSTELAKKIASFLSYPFIEVKVHKFSNNELKIDIDSSTQNELFNYSNEEFILVGSTSYSANDNLMELLLLSNRIREHAKRITAVIPYLAYTRQDKDPVSINLISKLLKVSGIDKIITLDIHSEKCLGYFEIEVNNISASTIFLEHLKPNKDLVIVSPDAGGIKRAQIYCKKLNCELAVIEKIRSGFNKESSAINIQGNVNEKRCIIIDDIVDTADTLCNAVNLLHNLGAASIEGFITHGIFSSGAIEKILHSNLHKLYITDSIAHNNLPEKIETLSIAEIIAKSLKE